MCLIHDLGECFTGDIPTFIKSDADREVEDSLLNQWVRSLPEKLSGDFADLYKEMDAQETKEAKLYKALDNQPYSKTPSYNSYVTWETSTLRSWLNGYGSSSNI